MLLVNRQFSEEFRDLRYRYITARFCGYECISAFLRVAKRSQIHHIRAIRVFSKMEGWAWKWFKKDFNKERHDKVRLSRLLLKSFDSIRVIQAYVVDKEKRTLLDEVEVGKWKEKPKERVKKARTAS